MGAGTQFDLQLIYNKTFQTRNDDVVASMAIPTMHCKRTRSPIPFLALVALAGALLAAPSEVRGQWSAVYRNAIELDQASDFSLQELSGVTYLGPLVTPGSTNSPTNSTFQFATIQDVDGFVGRVDLQLADNGALISAVATGSVQIQDNTFDNEGIAFSNPTRNSVFVASESDPVGNTNVPRVREYDLFTGAVLQSVDLPPIWNTIGNTRPNRGFESVARLPHGQSLWTGNEEALTVDGPLSDDETGTTIRLQQLSLSGDSATAAKQYAYQVEPIHSANNPDRSGVADLVGLPDGTLLALERSAAAAIPLFLHRMFQVDFSAATDISSATYADGLTDHPYSPVQKSLVWSGAVHGFLGSNMEGLVVGPQLPNGNWSMLGVTDNGGGSNGNTIVAFELIPPTAYGDFDRNGDFDCDDVALLSAEILSGGNGAAFDLNGDAVVDHADQIAWRTDAAVANGFEVPYPVGDANLDGVTNEFDFAIWNAHRFASATEGLCSGDFNADGFVDGSDFNLWLTGTSPSLLNSAVPEPNSHTNWLLLVVGLGLMRRDNASQ